MDNFSLRSYLWLLVGLLIGAASVSAFAGDRYVYGGATEGSKDNALDRCKSAFDALPAAWRGAACSYSTPVCPPSQDGGGCSEVARYSYYNYGNTSQDPMWSGSNFVYSYCPDSAPTWSGTKCVKPEEVCDGKVIGTSSVSAILTGEPKGNQVCISNCVYSGTKVMCAPSLSGGTTAGGDAVSLAKVCEISGPFTPNKRSCDASVNGEPNIAKPYAMPPKPWYDNGKGVADCAASGGAWGQIDGVDTCVRGGAGSSGSGSTGTGSGKAITGTDTGSSSKTESTTDGSTKTTDTKTTTTCEGDSCKTTTTTTTTTVKSDGSKETKTDTKTDDISSKSFCTDNPSSSLCVKNSFNGDCNSELACSGDPVLCATAKATLQTKCAMEATKEVRDSGLALMADGGDEISKKALERTENDVSELVHTDATGGGECVPDRSVSIGSVSVVVPFSSLCGGMAIMRVALLAIAGLTAAYIIIGGVK